MNFDDLFDCAERLRTVFPDLRSSLPAAKVLQQALALLLAPEDESPGISTRRMTFERLCRRPDTKTTLEDRAVRERKKRAVEALVWKWRELKKWRHSGQKMTTAEKDDMWAYVDALRNLPEDSRPSFFDCGQIVGLPDGSCRTRYNRWRVGRTKTVTQRAEDLEAELLNLGDNTIFSQSGEEHPRQLISSDDDLPASSSPDTSFNPGNRANNDDTSSQQRISMSDTDKSEVPTSTNKKRGADAMSEGNTGAENSDKDEPSSASVSSASSISGDSSEDEAHKRKKAKKAKKGKKQTKKEHFNWTADGDLIWRKNVIIPKSKLLEWLPKNSFSHNDSRRKEVSPSQMKNYTERIEQNVGKSKWTRMPENLVIEVFDMIFKTNLYVKKNRHVIAGVGSVGVDSIVSMRSRMGMALKVFGERMAETSEV